MTRLNQNSVDQPDLSSARAEWESPELNKLGSVSHLTESGSQIGVETLVDGDGVCQSYPARQKNITPQC